MLKLLLTLVLFSLSINLYSAPAAADCIAALNTSLAETSNHHACKQIEGKEIAVVTPSTMTENKALAHVQLSKRQPSLAESLMAIFFIPGLILLWFSRFTKSSK